MPSDSQFCHTVEKSAGSPDRCCGYLPDSPVAGKQDSEYDTGTCGNKYVDGKVWMSSENWAA